MVSPNQPWIDGYCVEQGFIRQFVAMPLGAGYSAEEQITGAGEHGGIQLVVYPKGMDAHYIVVSDDSLTSAMDQYTKWFDREVVSASVDQNVDQNASDR